MDIFLQYGNNYQRRQDALFIVSCTLTGLAAIAVFLRCIGRFIIIRMPGPDDYFLIAALLGVVGYLAGMFVAKGDHMGFPASNLTPTNMVNFLKTALAIQIIYSGTLFCIKTSICFTYLRFAVATKFRRLCIGTIAVHAAYFFITVITLIFQCQPVEKLWDITGTVKGKCINNTAFFYASSSFHILTDIWILLLPISTLMTIRRRNSEKVALFAIFGVGAIATASSCVRLQTIYVYTLSDDPFRDAVPVNLWTMIETSVAVICASVPGIKPIFSRSRPSGTRETNSQNKGGSKLSHLRRRREERKQKAADDSLGISLGTELMYTSVADDQSPVQPPGPLPVAGLDGRGGEDGRGVESAASTVHAHGGGGASDAESGLSASVHSSEQSIMGGTRHAGPTELHYPHSWPLRS